MLAQISAAIPPVPSPPSPRQDGEFPEVRNKSAGRVLVVDDERLVRWSIAEVLHMHGFHVTEAADARSALTAASDPWVAPDAVLLDLNLPDSADLGLLAALRRIIPHVPIILMTAFGTPELCAEARRLGAFSVIGKPYDLDDVDRVVERALGRQPPL
jgi:DNA-binding NtrC family response regulator